jgi:hypothetical protein
MPILSFQKKPDQFCWRHTDSSDELTTTEKFAQRGMKNVCSVSLPSPAPTGANISSCSIFYAIFNFFFKKVLEVYLLVQIYSNTKDLYKKFVKDRKKINFGGNIGKENIWHKVLKRNFNFFFENIRVEQKIWTHIQAP